LGRNNNVIGGENLPKLCPPPLFVRSAERIDPSITRVLPIVTRTNPPA